MLALGDELFWAPAVPPAAKKEDDGRAFVFCLPTFWFKSIKVKFFVADSFIEILLSCGNIRRIITLGYKRKSECENGQEYFHFLSQ